LSEEAIVKKWETQPMLKPKIEKVVVNLNVGKSGEPLEKASIVLKELTDQTPIKRKAKDTIRDFGIRMGEPIAVVVTLRKQKAIDFLKKVLPVVDNKISRSSFDKQGNFAFGIKEHIEIIATISTMIRNARWKNTKWNMSLEFWTKPKH